MTRPHRPRFYRGPQPPAPPGKSLSAEELEAILGGYAYYPATLGGTPSTCSGCGVTISPGETVWWPDNHQHVVTLLCYACGLGFRLHTGRTVGLAGPGVPPYAGGYPAHDPAGHLCPSPLPPLSPHAPPGTAETPPSSRPPAGNRP